MITKSDIAILLISFSVLMLGLYRTIDASWHDKLNPGQWLPFFKSSEKVMQAEVGGIAQNNAAPTELTTAPTKPTKLPKEHNTAAIETVSNHPVDQPAREQPQIAAATKPAQQSAAQRPLQPPPQVVATAAIVSPANGSTEARVPGKTTVLVLSPHGNRTHVTNLNQLTDSDGADENSDEPLAEFATELATEFTNEFAAESDNLSATEPEQPAAAREPEKQQLLIHEVQSGENLTKIAANLGTTVERLKQINRLTSDRIMAGQNLVYEN